MTKVAQHSAVRILPRWREFIAQKDWRRRQGIADHGEKEVVCAACGKTYVTHRLARNNSRCLYCAITYAMAKARCEQAVARAIKRGDLARPHLFGCTDCDQQAEVYDHRDYSRPLEVAPVCRGCNTRRGPARLADIA